jgi:hypothetical protein
MIAARKALLITVLGIKRGYELFLSLNARYLGHIVYQFPYVRVSHIWFPLSNLSSP